MVQGKSAFHHIASMEPKHILDLGAVPGLVCHRVTRRHGDLLPDGCRQEP